MCSVWLSVFSLFVVMRFYCQYLDFGQYGCILVPLFTPSSCCTLLCSVAMSKCSQSMVFPLPTATSTKDEASHSKAPAQPYTIDRYVASGYKLHVYVRVCCMCVCVGLRVCVCVCVCVLACMCAWMCACLCVVMIVHDY